MIDHTKTEKDRRDSVRVTGRNLFSFQVVSLGKFAAVKADFDEGIPPYNQQGLADIQVFIGAQSALSRIRERDEDLGDFLSHLDTKMNLLLKKASKEKIPGVSLCLPLGGNGCHCLFDGLGITEIETICRF